MRFALGRFSGGPRLDDVVGNGYRPREHQLFASAFQGLQDLVAVKPAHV